MLNKKVYSFIFINFLITWGCWVLVILLTKGPLEQTSPTYILYGLGGLLGPVVAAFISMKVFSVSGEFRIFLKELVKVRVGFGWYVYVLAVPFFLGVLPYLIDYVFTGKFQLRFDQPYYTVLFLLPMMILGGGLEEVGWRGVLLPEFLKKLTPLSGTIFLSVIWAVWHIPLWFMAGTVQYGSNFGWFFVSIMGTAILLSALYIRTKSILMCILLHALFNANSVFFQPVTDFHAWNEAVSVTVKLIICFGMFVFLLKGRSTMIKVTGGETNAGY